MGSPIDSWEGAAAYFTGAGGASPTIILVMASFGLMLMVRSVVQMVAGTSIQSMVTGIQRPMIFFDASQNPWSIRSSSALRIESRKKDPTNAIRITAARPTAIRTISPREAAKSPL